MRNTEQEITDDSIIQENTIQNNQIDQKDKQKDKLSSDKDRIAELEKEIHEIQKREHESLLRTRAELENIRKRSLLEIEKVYKFSLERFISELLPVIDSLERTLEISNKMENNKQSSIIEGIELTLKSFLDTMKKFGLDIIDKVNIPFNPQIHEAINTIESKEYQPNSVIKMIQKGYLLHNRLIRPAMVTVSKSIEIDQDNNNK
ncbi:nucleotide exchange factor GrpE [Candidatus Schneideria nysicola]|uniref:nucleotide exchange factor GrpE n=1 Tax=Candidatus Schneideria nysicola TaxID=1081631 RepID=UPI001CAA6942|nr:nucleotide exchange factor GrpE [Candidatus Schneideria nysicola]UAJ65156.1 nucleotide exchange factor GrpE [Candidatus Schneideria nysicola]